MIASAPGQGRPLMALGAVLLGWLALRLAGFGDPDPERAPVVAARARLATAGAATTSGSARVLGTSGMLRARAQGPGGSKPRAGRTPEANWSGSCSHLCARQEIPPPVDGPSEIRANEQEFAGQDASSLPGRSDHRRQIPRWSADAWLLWRGGAGAVGGATFYGASQAGAVVRYRLQAADPHRPVVYLRAAAALAATAEQDAALGIGLRPLPGMPVMAGLEARLTRSRFATRLHPAVLAVSELPPVGLPFKLVGDLYAQGGWIAGPDAGAFGELQFKAERALAGRAGWHARIGAGLWAAGQSGAQRLDLGPVASVIGRAGNGPLLRLEVDWRLRAAGNAAPGSGPALVLASGF